MELLSQFKFVDIKGFSHLLKDGEMAIKNISDSDNRVYARRYIYKGYDLCITSDRVLPLEYNITIDGDTKLVDIVYKHEIGEFIPKSPNPLYGKEVRINLNSKK